MLLFAKTSAGVSTDINARNREARDGARGPPHGGDSLPVIPNQSFVDQRSTVWSTGGNVRR